MNMKIYFILSWCTFLLIVATATKLSDDGVENLENVEKKLTEVMDDIDKNDTINIYGNLITLEKVPVKEYEARDPEDPLVRRIEKFIWNRRVQIRLPNDGSPADLFGRALGEKNIDIELKNLRSGTSEARTRLKKMILPVLLALKLKALIILPIIITLIGLISIKGLGVSLAALLLSGSVAMRSLLTPPSAYPARVSYGIIKPAEFHHEHWHRSQEEINNGPHRSSVPEYNIDPYFYQDIP